MSSADQVQEQIKNALEPYILPREEVSYRRRILALHLQSCVKGGSASEPLALVKPSRGINPSSEIRGLQREYLKALEANISARNQHEKVRQELGSRGLGSESGRQATPESTIPNPLEEHLTKIKLQRKQTRLQAVEKHIELLGQKPAASSSFLDPEEIFRDTRPLPDVPAEVVDGLALGQTGGQADLKDLIDRLEKQVPRAKFLLKGEEQLLDAVKRRSTTRPENISEYAKLTALNATRTELINWMEAELSKASGDMEEDDEGEGDQGQGTKLESGHMDEQLASIKEKYAHYLAARKSLLQLVGQKPQPTIVPMASMGTESEGASTAAPAPVTYLLTPYLESLLSVAHEQKGLIGQKSHLNTTIAKQLKETARVLDHLAEESHLLPSHPMPGASRRKLGFGEKLTTSENLESCSRVKPWVYAAESAKIATLEAVAEKIEEGQLSLEGSMRILQDIDQLLERGSGAEEKVESSEATEDDIWLTETKHSGKAAAARKHARKASKADKSTDLWAFLDGNLGLLKSNEPA
jgi:exonuclease VII small subunit